MAGGLAGPPAMIPATIHSPLTGGLIDYVRITAQYGEALDIMQLNATKTKVEFNEHVGNGRWPLC